MDYLKDILVKSDQFHVRMIGTPEQPKEKERTLQPFSMKSFR